jgi:hypothetical protein
MERAKVILVRGFEEYFALQVGNKILRLSQSDYGMTDDPEAWFTWLANLVNARSIENDLILKEVEG